MTQFQTAVTFTSETHRIVKVLQTLCEQMFVMKSAASELNSYSEDALH
jgi:hypothetical protein